METHNTDDVTRLMWLLCPPSRRSFDMAVSVATWQKEFLGVSPGEGVSSGVVVGPVSEGPIE